MNIKKKQHYVSQFYLKKWSYCEDRIYSLVNDRIVPMKIKEIASSNFFYKATNMTDKTKSILLHGLSKLKSPYTRNAIKTAIESVHLVEAITKNSDYKDPDLEHSENLVRTNIIEEYYAVIEELAAPDIKNLAESSGDNFTFENYQNVLRFVVNQLTRTSAVKEKFKNLSRDSLEKEGVDFQTFNAFHTLIISEELVLVLIEKLYKITLLDNQSEVNLITSDNPAININPITIPEVKIYFPLSPKKALYIEPSHLNEISTLKIKENYLSGIYTPTYYIEKATIHEQEVRYLNGRIFENRDRCIYGLTSEDLENVLIYE